MKRNATTNCLQVELVDSTGSAGIVPGTGATSLGKAEDAAHASGDTGVAILAKRTDTAAQSAGTDGDYSFVNNDNLGHLWAREGYAPSFEDNTVGRAKVSSPCAWSYISSATTTVCKTGAGVIESLDITETAGGTITVYDNAAASGTVIAVLKASIAEAAGYLRGRTFSVGLTVVTAGASKLNVGFN
jgi:hypothetical protein